MDLSEEEAKNIIKSQLNVIAGIASKSFQKRIWIQHQGPEIDDFEETCNEFFGECDSIIDHYKKFGISNHQLAL